jgi:dienelactone hydrolase
MRFLWTAILFIPLIALTASNGHAAMIKTQTIEYKSGDITCEGYLAYDSTLAGVHPGVLIVHQWRGITDYEKMRAQSLAKMGYIAFVADIYGKGIRPQTNEEAMKQVGPYYNDRALFRSRVNAGFDQLKQYKSVDTTRIAAIGYCFGGSGVLELARSGAHLNGVVSFHGGLTTPTPDDAKNIKAKVLVLTGADDPNVPFDQVKAFEDEMTKGGVDWQLVSYGGAVHSFTIPTAGNDNSTGSAYNEKADKRSWEAMKSFFAEIFK